MQSIVKQGYKLKKLRFTELNLVTGAILFYYSTFSSGAIFGSSSDFTPVCATAETTVPPSNK